MMTIARFTLFRSLGCAGALVLAASALVALLPLRAATPAPSIADNRPNIFGSIALPVRHTPLDAKWRIAGRANLSSDSGPWISTLHTVRALNRKEKAEIVNRWVNARVAFVADAPRGNADRWSTAATTLAARRGDCEDVAIAKMKLLEAAGVPRSDLYLVIAFDLARRADHALLAVRDGTALFILDNATDVVLDDARVPDYRPIMTLSAERAWIHGFPQRAAPAQTVLASAR